MVFGVGLDYFFTDERKRRVVGVVRREERVRFPEKPGVQDVQYYFECLDYRATERKLSAFLADFQELPAGKIKPHQHAGVEFLYVLKGSSGTENWRRRISIGAGRRDLFRRGGGAQLPQARREAVYGCDCHGTLVTGGAFSSRRQFFPSWYPNCSLLFVATNYRPFHIHGQSRRSLQPSRSRLIPRSGHMASRFLIPQAESIFENAGFRVSASRLFQEDHRA